MSTSWEYYDIDAILSEQQRVPCTFKYSIPNHAFLEGGEQQGDLKSGTRAELPFWIAANLAAADLTSSSTTSSEASLIELQVPKHYGSKVRNALDASPVSIDCKALSRYYFSFGQKLVSLIVADELTRSLREAFQARLSAIMNHAMIGTSMGEADFLQMLDETEIDNWEEYYLSYDDLKALLRDAASETRTETLFDAEGHDETEIALRRFTDRIYQEADKIISFYAAKEEQLLERLEKVCRQSERIVQDTEDIVSTQDLEEARGFALAPVDDDYEADGGEENAKLLDNDIAPPQAVRKSMESSIERLHPLIPKDINTSSMHVYIVRKQVVDLYILFHELLQFKEVNRDGFEKLTSKYTSYWPDLSILRGDVALVEAYPFTESDTEKINAALERLENCFLQLQLDDAADENAILKHLRSQVRPNWVSERTTVWKDLQATERRSANLLLRRSSYGGDDSGILGRLRKSVARGDNFWKLTLVLLGFIVLFGFSMSTIFSAGEANRCFGIFLLCSLLWASEVIPLFATSMLIPFLVVLLQVLKDENGQHLSAPDAMQAVFSAMFSPVIMLLLGGFAVAAALSKHQIAKTIALWLLSFAGNNPKRVLLANMLVATFMSMWISNVAAPVLCFSFIQPIIRPLSSSSTFPQKLILGIALASNIGGMASPISSPQNVIAMANMNPPPSWFHWFVVTIPVCLLADFSIWLLLLLWDRPREVDHSLSTQRPPKLPRTWQTMTVLVVTVVTILLWCFSHALSGLLGGMGIIALIPLVVFFSSGILIKEDFNNFPWTVVMLAMGGIVLGHAANSSGLLLSVATYIQKQVGSLSVFQVLVIFALFVVTVATFISHTVAALIILPIVSSVGANMESSHTRLLVMGSTLMCSAAMGLPVSGFPNMNAISLEDEFGNPYLSVADFIKTGLPASFISFLCVVLPGYLLMQLVGL
ncbi:hypothetical protein BZG36_01769 [Bifiguratus adelaidae]|uniref:SPX domain-containing protein n=1 Tax=Bifiguratus adelaidae TaxID=1938954 RepID=A0A261Y300_9FUNG|nr:hypothetical protein BZG36_01769 [Bifiguratus adelaidae]